MLSNNQYISLCKISTKLEKLNIIIFILHYIILKNNLVKKKHSATHYLNIDINSKINIGIFESVLWQSRTETYNRGYEISYLNPNNFL